MVNVYYIDTIEQVKGTEEGTFSVYGKREQWKLPFEQVESKYFKKLSDVTADLVTIDDTKNHYFMDIRIVDYKGAVLEKKTVGQYQE